MINSSAFIITQIKAYAAKANHIKNNEIMNEKKKEGNITSLHITSHRHIYAKIMIYISNILN